MNAARTWRSTDRLPDGTTFKYVLEQIDDHFGLERDPPARYPIASQVQLKILRHFIETMGARFSRDDLILAVWPETQDGRDKQPFYRNLGTQLTNLRDYLQDRQPDNNKSAKESGRLLISIDRGRLLRFGGTEIVVPGSNRAELKVSEPHERLKSYAASLMNELRFVRPLSGMSLTSTDFSRESHFIERLVTHYQRGSEKPAKEYRDSQSLLDVLCSTRAHLGLMAPAGMGKTSILEHLAYLSAGQLLEGPHPQFIPVLIRLGALHRPTDIRKQLEAQLLERPVGKLLPEDIVKTELIAFIEGLDELPVSIEAKHNYAFTEVEAQLLDLIEGGITVRGQQLKLRSSLLASRPEGIQLCNLLPHFRNAGARLTGAAPHVLSLEPFTAPDQIKYATQFFAESGQPQPANSAGFEALKKQLTSTLNADSPILLYFLCYLNAQAPFAADFSPPQTAVQLILTAIRRNLAQRGHDLTEAHLRACAAIAFAERIRGILSVEEAINAVVGTCLHDIDDTVRGLAAALNIRRVRSHERPSIDQAAVAVLIREILCVRTGLLQLNVSTISAVDRRVGDVLVVYHLRELTRTCGFGFDDNRKCAVEAIQCIKDPVRADGASETVAQAVSRWAWNRRWSNVLRDLVILLAEDGQGAALITMLAEFNPIAQINPRGDADGGNRLVLAMKAFLRAKPVFSSAEFVRLRTRLLGVHVERKFQWDGLSDLVAYVVAGELPTSNSSEVKKETAASNEREFRESLAVASPERLLEALRKQGRDDLCDALIETRRHIQDGNISDSILRMLAHAIASLPSIDDSTFAVLVRVLSLSGIGIDDYPLFVELLYLESNNIGTPDHTAIRNSFRTWALLRALTKALLEVAVAGALDNPDRLRLIFELQPDASDDLFRGLSEVFQGRRGREDRFYFVADPLAGACISSQAVEVLSQLIGSGEPRHGGRVLRPSAMALLARTRCSDHTHDATLSAALSHVLRHEHSSRGWDVIRFIPYLVHFELDHSELYQSICDFVARFPEPGMVSTDPELLSAALACIARSSKLIDDAWLKTQIDQARPLGWKILKTFASHGFAVARRYGVLWDVVGLADTDPDWGVSSMCREAGFRFVRTNARALCDDRDFLPALQSRQRTSYLPNYNEIFALVVEHCGSLENAWSFLMRLNKLNPSWASALFAEYQRTMSDLGIFMREARPNCPGWMETVDRLMAAVPSEVF